MNYPHQYHRACQALNESIDQAELRAHVGHALRALRRQGRTRDQVKQELRLFALTNPTFLKP